MSRARTLLAAPAALALALAVAAAPAGAAQTKGATGLHDKRYCEILELRGLPPTATAVVWNTLGLNACPASWWNAFDAPDLAKELGATAVVLNGPRHFLMDSVTGARTGRVRSFHGQRLREVAALPIRTAIEMAQTPYTERTVDRTNVWRWKAGRRIFELIAPGGTRYVMQAYAQIKDRHLTLGRLPRLGSRLHLPAGWRYRSRVLRRPLALGATGSATILQDDLQDTYQRVPLVPPRGTRLHRVHLRGAAKTVGSPTPGTLEDRGTVRGAPFGAGQATLVVRLAAGTATGTFRFVTKRGSARGTLDLTYVISGDEITFDGTASFTGGTGAYRRITGQRLKAHDHNHLDGQSGTFSLDGEVAY
jgi:hypothetical protein